MTTHDPQNAVPTQPMILMNHGTSGAMSIRPQNAVIPRASMTSHRASLGDCSTWSSGSGPDTLPPRLDDAAAILPSPQRTAGGPHAAMPQIAPVRATETLGRVPAPVRRHE